MYLNCLNRQLGTLPSNYRRILQTSSAPRNPRNPCSNTQPIELLSPILAAKHHSALPGGASCLCSLTHSRSAWCVVRKAVSCLPQLIGHQHSCTLCNHCGECSGHS